MVIFLLWLPNTKSGMYLFLLVVDFKSDISFQIMYFEYDNI